MKYNFKKIITVFISCALLITFAGCGESWERNHWKISERKEMA